MRSIDDLERYKKYGFVLTPVKQNKMPETKNNKWHYDWSDEELLKADRLGFYHKESNVFTLDFDDKTYEAHKYISLFPLTFRDGKEIDDKMPTTHLTYKVNGQGALKFKYPPRAKGKEDGLLIETLTSTHTWFHSNDESRFEVFTDCPPEDVDINLLRKYCSLTCFMVEVSRNFPPGNVGARDEAHLRLTGALAKLDEKEYPTDLLNKFHERFCHIIGDTKEIKNRMKIDRQRTALASGKKVYGITELRSHLNSELEAYNLLFEQKEEELQELETDKDPKEYPLIDGLTLDSIEYPKVDYLMNPILSTRSFNQIYGWYESGKTIFGLALSIAMSSGNKFLDWECDNKIPSIYVESELPGDVFKSYRWSILQGYLDDGKKFDGANHFTLTHDDLANAGFQYGFKSIAVAKAHGKDAAKDYGRRGREILLDLFMKIKQRTGKAPFYFLDNMSRLATFDENKQPDWEPFINWGIDLKNKGIPGCFLHHANKGEGKGSSGSSFIGRLLDTSIQLTKLEDDYRFPMKGNKNLQSSIRFDKSRGFGGSSWANKRILTMDENGQWKHYPFLKQISFVILGLANQGHTQEQIREMAKNKEVRDMKDNAYSSSHVDKLYKELVHLKLIKKDRESFCWKCKQEISHDAHERCKNCDYGIICNHVVDGKECGVCHCENPKKKKRKK
jgi:hypothetical protein